MGCQVVIITFGERQGALRWKEEAKTDFPIFVDSDRKLYKYFGMKRSIAQCWSRSTTSYFVDVVNNGRKLIAPYADVEDDVLQMGGDILLNSKSSILEQHLSKFSADRPNVQSFINKMK